MAKKKMTIEDLALKMDGMSDRMDKSFKDARGHIDTMFKKSMKHTDDALEQIVLPRLTNLEENQEELQLGQNRIELKLNAEVKRHDDHGSRIEQIEKRVGIK